MLINPFSSVVKVGFVVAVEIGEVDFEPAKTAFAERFGFVECEETTAEVVSDVVEMCWDRVGASPEIEVMREVECVVKELKGRPHEFSILRS